MATDRGLRENHGFVYLDTSSQRQLGMNRKGSNKVFRQYYAVLRSSSLALYDGNPFAANVGTGSASSASGNGMQIARIELCDSTWIKAVQREDLNRDGLFAVLIVPASRSSEGQKQSVGNTTSSSAFNDDKQSSSREQKPLRIKHGKSVGSVAAFFASAKASEDKVVDKHDDGVVFRVTDRNTAARWAQCISVVISKPEDLLRTCSRIPPSASVPVGLGFEPTSMSKMSLESNQSSIGSSSSSSIYRDPPSWLDRPPPPIGEPRLRHGRVLADGSKTLSSEPRIRQGSRSPVDDRQQKSTSDRQVLRSRRSLSNVQIAKTVESGSAELARSHSDGPIPSSTANAPRKFLGNLLGRQSKKSSPAPVQGEFVVVVVPESIKRSPLARTGSATLVGDPTSPVLESGRFGVGDAYPTTPTFSDSSDGSSVSKEVDQALVATDTAIWSPPTEATTRQGSLSSDTTSHGRPRRGAERHADHMMSLTKTPTTRRPGPSVDNYTSRATPLSLSHSPSVTGRGLSRSTSAMSGLSISSVGPLGPSPRRAVLGGLSPPPRSFSRSVGLSVLAKGASVPSSRSLVTFSESAEEAAMQTSGLTTPS